MSTSTAQNTRLSIIGEHETPALCRELISGIENGLHIGAQVFISNHGRVEADFAVGHARPGVALTPDTVSLWMSATKPITAIAIAQQWEQGNIDLDAPVKRYIPQFAKRGKEAVTIRHILTHTGGFRSAKFNFPDDGWDEIIEAICDATLEPGWTPGDKAGYHPRTSWFILGEIVQRVTGEPLPRYVRANLFEKMGMDDCWLGMPQTEYYRLGERLMVMQDTSDGKPRAKSHHTLRWCVACHPGANGYGPVNQLARFYQMLLNGGEIEGERIIEPETVEWFTSRHREKLHDHTFKFDLDWGLGFMINRLLPVGESDDDDRDKTDEHGMPYGFGPAASRDTFGHSGNQSAIAFADPEHQLVVALVCNGMPGEEPHHRRMHRLLGAVYRDLNIG